MKRQSGFTLIELIIVIVILGILAVTAAPQFFNFGSDARESTVRGLEGSVKSAADLVYARAAINGIESQDLVEEGDDGVVTVNNQFITTVYGYPAATEQGILLALNLSTGDWNSGVATGTPSGAGETGDFLIFPAERALDSANSEGTACYVYYRAATETTRPEIGSVTTGC